MPWSLVADGRVRDISFRSKSCQDDLVTYQVYVGEEKWGAVSWYSARSGWIAQSFNFPDGHDQLTLEELLDFQESRTRSLMYVGGFQSRKAAATYIIKHHGYWKNS